MRWRIAAILSCLVCLGCASVFAPKLGMTRNQWMRRTLIGDLVTMKDNWEVWKSGGRFYYFKDGVLDHIDQGLLMQQRFQIEVIQKQQ